MKKLLVVVSTTLFCNLYFPQKCSDSTLQKKPKIIGFSPSKNTKNVNGILVKYFDEMDQEISPKKVNGVGLGFNLLGAFFPFLIVMNLPDIDNWSFVELENKTLPEKMNKINGLQLSIINMEPTITNGIEVNIASNISAPSVINGISISPLYNIHHTQKGIAIATFANVGVKCRGVQIAVINKCTDFKGLQIGFWNNNGKRSLPIINF